MGYEMLQLAFLLEDFDKDGSIDIASYAYVNYPGMDNDTCFIRVDYNDGDGRFGRFAETPLIQPEWVWYNGYQFELDNPYYLMMASGDFNGDSFLDIAVANDYHANTESGLGYLCNDGTGNFAAEAVFSIGSLYVPTVCDMNHDKKDGFLAKDMSIRGSLTATLLMVWWFLTSTATVGRMWWKADQLAIHTFGSIGTSAMRNSKRWIRFGSQAVSLGMMGGLTI